MATCLDFGENDEYMATGHKDGKVRIWDLETRTILHELLDESYGQITSIVCVAGRG